MIALCAVTFAALLPATSSFARTLMSGDVVTLGAICTSHAPADPVMPVEPAATHGHCAFCTLGAPLVSAPRVEILLVTLDVPATVSQAHRNHALPRDVVAIHPLSPRAPPRAI
ncbi:MAG TPA: DUF2946 family protein [Burkholderiales bacterium]|nr:DUF2946 family protein [Burkholderiales bacterium]